MDTEFLEKFLERLQQAQKRGSKQFVLSIEEANALAVNISRLKEKENKKINQRLDNLENIIKEIISNKTQLSIDDNKNEKIVGGRW